MERGWRIELLGELRVRRGDQIVSRFPKQLAASLLAYLACHPQQPHPRDVLLEALCPELALGDARNSLRAALHLLRRLLEPLDPSATEPLLIANRHHIRLNPAAFTTDLAEFEAAFRAAARAALDEQFSHLARAVELYRGELLAGFTEEWVFTERWHRAEQYLEALHRLVSGYEQQGDLERALEYGRRAVLADPLREEAHYDLMRLYAAAGQPSACLQQYQELERLLQEELNEKPSAAARALAEELRRSARRLVVARPLAAASPPAAAGSGPAPTAPDTPPERPGPPESRLPLPLTRFFGREEEIARLAELLASPLPRLVTVTGPGGSGKTRLAIAVAGRLREQLDEAVTFVPLADLSDPRHLLGVIADALGLERAPDAPLLEQVTGYLARCPWLLVLDNFEQLVAGRGRGDRSAVRGRSPGSGVRGRSPGPETESGAVGLRVLLERVPTLTCLVTSRQHLGIGGEQEFVLLPLPTPRRSDPPERLREYASVQLFVDRARAVRPGFELTDSCAGAVAELCDRLEGLPLALELAAARIRVLTPEQILSRLSSRFELLESRQRDLPARHRSLRAAMEWSYQLLTPELQRFFARLSVFRGGWTLEAAEAVAGVGSWELGRTTDRPCRPQLPTPNSQLPPLISWSSSRRARWSSRKSRRTVPPCGTGSWRPCASSRRSDWRPRNEKRWPGGMPSTSWPSPRPPSRTLRARTIRSGWTGWRPSTTITGRRCSGARRQWIVGSG